MATTKSTLTLANREILPINQGKFGVVITKEEAAVLKRDGYRVIDLPVRSRRKKNDVVQYHIEVYITAKDKEEDKFDIAMLETVGHVDEVVIIEYPWNVAGRTGIKLYAKSVRITGKPEKPVDRYDIAWRIWCWQQGYNTPEDRGSLNNWMRDDERSLHPNDIRDRDALLPIADEVIAMARGSHGADN